MVEVLGLLSGLWLFGVWRAIRNVWNENGEPRQHRLPFLLAWTACALFAWLSAGDERLFATHLIDLWETFFVLSALLMVAFAIDEIADRRAGVLAVTLLFAATLAAVHWHARASGDPADAVLSPQAAGIAAGVLLALVWTLRRMGANRDLRQRVVLAVLVLGLVALHSAAGFQAARNAGAAEPQLKDERALALVRKQLLAIHQVVTCTLITALDPPHRLEFLLRGHSRSAKAGFTVVENWNGALAHVAAHQASVRESTNNAPVFVFIEWVPSGSRANADARGVEVRLISPWEYFQDEPLRVFVVTPR
jgi:hypothetical protein